MLTRTNLAGPGSMGLLSLVQQLYGDSLVDVHQLQLQTVLRPIQSGAGWLVKNTNCHYSLLGVVATLEGPA